MRLEGCGRGSLELGCLRLAFSFLECGYEGVEMFVGSLGRMGG